MKSRDFVYWLQGYFEISGATNVGEPQIAIIKNHLNMVFKHEIDPSNGNEEHNKMLSEVHKGTQGSSAPQSKLLYNTGINC